MQHAFRAGGRGRPVTMLGPAPGAPLELTVRVPDGVDRDHRGPIGTFTVANPGDRTVEGRSGPAAWAWVARDGVVVSEPGAMPAVAVPVELAPGQSFTSDLYSLLPDGGAEALPPGRYEVYVRWDLRDHDGTEIALYAGPTGFELR
ncbi:hypothetical protein [Jiangella mangrovi]|uniref:Uncharacterized protein n=1 Tax=Jiangella mangrovi TaxID=1524084 RepID=A0A7W9GVL6_9ACTN|nr:hypothetical protein [Jiangella mangrovi]MBB5790892.1 hypothetical protein [Jiangella mangrovi]